MSIVPVPSLVCSCSHIHLSIGQDRIEITSENMSSWLADSPIVREFIRYDGEWVTSGLSEDLKLQPGDTMWIGKQHDRPEVRSFVYPSLSCQSDDRIPGRFDGTWSAETSPG